MCRAPGDKPVEKGARRHLTLAAHIFEAEQRLLPVAAHAKGDEHTIGNDWCDEISARRLFNEVTPRYRELAKHMW